MFKKLNLYFFDSEEINLSDALWFYGYITIAISIVVGTLVIVT